MLHRALIWLLLWLVFVPSTYAQRSTKESWEVPVNSADPARFRVPRNINQCCEILDRILNEERIAVIRALPEDSLGYHSLTRAAELVPSEWKLFDGSRITRYFNRKGLYDTPSFFDIIIISYSRYTQKKKINLPEQVAKSRLIEKKDREQYWARLKQDSIAGIYIPVDLRECFVQLDKILEDSLKRELKALLNSSEMGKYHHGLGTWLRNSWGIWSGSRLQMYLLERGGNQPDDMSAMILEYYHDWLNDRHDRWQKWVTTNGKETLLDK